MSTIKLIVGLANPGPQYSDTRHNAGAWFVEQLARDHQADFKPDQKFHGFTTKIHPGGSPVHLLIPTTFMNRSGQAVQAMSHFYKINPDEILVAHDELDFSAGVARLKLEGGHGGHNGLRDIIQKLGGARDFPRLRIGIGHPGDKSKVHSYVLKNPNSQDKQSIEDAIRDAANQIDSIAVGDLAKAMNQLHTDKE